MITLLLILGACLIAFFGYLYYRASNPYREEIIQQGQIMSQEYRNPTGDWYFIKRTYKNGKIEFVNKKVTY